MHKFFKRPGAIWLLALIIANVFYLIYEFAFNARLTDAATGSLKELSESGILHALEMEGRTLSGIGLSLVGLRILFHFVSKGVPRAIGAALVCTLCFPAMFYGQKMVVDHMVNRTTAEQRQDAKLLLILRQGLSTGTLQLADMPIDPEDMDTAATRSLLSVVGMMTFASKDFIAQIRDQSDAIIDHVADEEARKVLPDAYAFYKRFEGATAENWTRYQDAVAQMRQEEINLAARAEEAWSELQQDLVIAWKSSQERAEEALSSKRVEMVRENLEYFMQRNADCVSNSRKECDARSMDRYNKAIHETFGRDIKPEFWCHDARTISEQVMRGSRILTQKTEIRDCSDMSFSHVRSKMASLIGAVDFEAFVASDSVAESAKGRLYQAGLDLPDDWTPADHEAFIQAYMAHGQQSLKEAYREKITAASGQYLPPDMSVDEFVSLDSIQSPIREALGLSSTAITPLNLDSEAFLDGTLTPIYVAYGQEQKEDLWADTELHADGAILEEEGKSAVRALVVPGIAMSFSLVFVALNSIGMISSLARLTLSPRMARVTQVSAFALAIAVPFALSTSTRSSSYQYLEEEFSRNFGGISGLFATWVVNAEPLAYALGTHVARIAPPLFKGEASASDASNILASKE